MRPSEGKWENTVAEQHALLAGWLELAVKLLRPPGGPQVARPGTAKLQLGNPSRHGVVDPWGARFPCLAGTDSDTAVPERALLMSGSRYGGLAPSTDGPCSEADSKTCKRPRLAPPVRHLVRDGPPQPARLWNVCSIRGCPKSA